MRKLLATLPYARNLISHRCPELSDDDINALMQPDLPDEISLIMDVLDLMMDPLNELAALVEAKEDNDDGDHDERGDRRAGRCATVHAT
jgi:hypothetical protein